VNAVMQLCLALLLCTKVGLRLGGHVPFRASEATCQGLAETPRILVELPGRVKIQLENE